MTMTFLVGFFVLWVSWLQPMHVFPWLSWHSELLAFIALVAMVSEACYIMKTRPISGITVPVTALPLMGLVVLIVIQWMVGLIPLGGDAIVYTAYILLCIVSISLGYLGNRANFSPTLVLGSTLVLGAVCSAIIAFAQAFEVWESYGWIHRAQYPRRPGANIGQPNQLATLLLMGLVSILYLYERAKLGRLISSVLVAVLIPALAITESRSGMLGIAALVAWWFAKYKHIHPRTKPWVVIFIGIAYLGLFSAVPSFMSEVFQYKNEINAFNNPAGFNRWLIWHQLFGAILLRPWAGWGFGQVAAAHNAVVDAYDTSEPYTYSHNVVIDFAIGLGLPMATLFVVLVMVWLWRRVRMIQKAEPWYCLAVAVPVLVHSLVEFPFAYAYFLVPVMFAIGVLEAELDVRSRFEIAVKPLAIGILVAASTLAWSVDEYLAIEEDYRVARFESLRVGTTAKEYQRPTIRIFTQLDALLHGSRIKPRPNMPVEEIELARVVALHFPMIATQNKYALSLALNGNAEEAVRQLRAMRAQQGSNTYLKIKQAWAQIAEEQYPQLTDLQMP